MTSVTANKHRSTILPTRPTTPPPMPALTVAPITSATWRAVEETAIETIRPARAA